MSYPEETGQNVLEVIKNIKDVLPQKQRQLCNYILANYKTLGMATVAELAKQANVGTTTVMRLISALKYTTYNDFKKDLFSAMILQDNSSYQSTKYALGDPKRQIEGDNSLSRVGSEIVGLVQNFLIPRNLEQYKQAVKLLSEATRINILAQRSSKAAALYMEYQLSSFAADRICSLSSDPDYVFDKILRIQEGEVVFIISNWPCGRNAIDAAQFCREKHIPILLVTNSRANPIARFADVCIDTNSVSSPCLLSPALLVIEALTLDLAQHMVPKSTQDVDQLETMLREKSILVW